jgi:D-sedoheptulose 7-phosphate isomerase
MKLKYFRELSKILSNIQITDSTGKPLVLEEAITRITNAIDICKNRGNKVILIGNGGSASVASHISTDLLKNHNLASITFNDSSLITCLSNDLGYEYVFKKPLELLSKEGDILFAISSSGMSKNIINAVNKAKKIGCLVITLSGFRKDNALRPLGILNFYAPSNSYGHVEVAHLAICHLIADSIKKYD